MTRARDIANLVDANGDIVAGALDNVPASNDASALTTGTLAAGRLPTTGVDASSLSTGTLNHGRLPSGTILQTVVKSTTTVATITSASYTGFGLSQSFTPKSSSSTILIFLAIAGEHYGFSDLGIRVELRKDSSQVRQWSYLDYHSSDSSQNISVQHLQYSESASNTNARTYDVRAQPSNGSGTARVNQYNAPSFMTIMEIEG